MPDTIATRHTPGPWRAEIARFGSERDAEIFGFSIVGKHDDPEAEPLAGIGVYRRRAATADYPPEVMKANAALLAAAPELLSLLKRAIEDQRECETMQGMIDWYDEAVAIIARVETPDGPVHVRTKGTL
jgi:hypothetical protein